MYFDDTFVYSKDHREHVDHLKVMSEVFRRQKLYAKLEKCEFFVGSVISFRYAVSKKGVIVDQSKVEVI